MNMLSLIGIILVFGYLLGRGFIKLGLTSILGYLLIGFIIGTIFKFHIPAGFGEIVNSLTLSLIGYTIGLSFSLDFLKEMGRKMVIILIVEVTITSIVVFLVVYVLTKNLPLSIMLASLSAATAPAGTIAVLREWRAQGSLTNMIIAIVGLDDAVGILLFTLGLALTKATLGVHGSLLSSFFLPVWEIIGAIILGGISGMIFNYVLRKINFSQDGIFVLSVAIPFLIWGIAQWMKVSSILSCMIIGTVLINLNPEKGNLSNSLVDNVMTPFFVLFFGSVGMTIKLAHLHRVGLISVFYCIGRSIGKYTGAYWGGRLAKAEEKIKKYLGSALLDQAGVAVGLAYLAAHELTGFEHLSNILVVSIALSTAIFQFLAPLGVQFSVKKSGEGHTPE